MFLTRVNGEGGDPKLEKGSDFRLFSRFIFFITSGVGNYRSVIFLDHCVSDDLDDGDVRDFIDAASIMALFCVMNGSVFICL